MRYSDLLQLRQTWLDANHHDPQLKIRAGYCAVILNFINFDPNNIEIEVDHQLINALTLALKIDSQNLAQLDKGSKEVAKNLKRSLSNKESIFITNLADAVTLLKESPALMENGSGKDTCDACFNCNRTNL